MPQRLKQVMQERKLHRHIECQHLFTKASHCTVQHHIKNHNDYLERINKKTDARVNELYAITYGTGRDVLNHYFEIPLESEMREMKWRLVIMVDEYPIWTNHQVIEKERII